MLKQITKHVLVISAFAVGFIHQAGAENSCEKILSSSINREIMVKVQKDLSQKVLGQDHLVDKVLIALLSNGHILLNGPTGIAKTRLVNMLAQKFDGTFKKEQMTVDTSPSDLKGSEYYDSQERKNVYQPGVLYSNFVLLDEINRGQPKSQNATLSAMEEREIVVNGTAHHLPNVFFLMATQNPSVHTGTFPLPEAQLDRFLMRVDVEYTDIEIEKEIARLALREMSQPKQRQRHEFTEAYSLEVVEAARKEVLEIPIQDQAEDYILHVVDATRNPSIYDRTGRYKAIVKSPVGPRATIGLMIAAKARAYLRGAHAAEIQDVDYILKDVLRHRLGVQSEALRHQNITVDEVIELISESVKEKLKI